MAGLGEIDPNQTLTYGALAVIIARELYGWAKGSAQKLVAATDANTATLIKVESTLESIKKDVSRLDKMEQDINEAHARIREMKAKYEK